VVIGTANLGSFASSELAWADLKRRAFDIDVLACSRCGGRLRLIGTVEDPDAICAILAAVAVPPGTPP